MEMPLPSLSDLFEWAINSVLDIEISTCIGNLAEVNLVRMLPILFELLSKVVYRVNITLTKQT